MSLLRVIPENQDRSVSAEVNLKHRIRMRQKGVRVGKQQGNFLKYPVTVE